MKQNELIKRYILEELGIIEYDHYLEGKPIDEEHFDTWKIELARRNRLIGFALKELFDIKNESIVELNCDVSSPIPLIGMPKRMILSTFGLTKKQGETTDTTPINLGERLISNGFYYNTVRLIQASLEGNGFSVGIFGFSYSEYLSSLIGQYRSIRLELLNQGIECNEVTATTIDGDDVYLLHYENQKAKKIVRANQYFKYEESFGNR